MRSVDQAQPWYGRWLVLACAFCNYVLIDGVRFSFGVLYVELLDAFGSGKSETAWIGSVQIGMFNLLGIIGGSILLRFGIKKTIMAGTLLSSVGLFSSSFATNVYVMYVTFGLLPGLGFIFMGLPSVVAVNQNFDTQQSLAMGICQAGGSVGGFLFNPLLQMFIENYGWKGALWLMSAILLHGIFFGLLINILGRRDTTTEKETKQQQTYEKAKFLQVSKTRFYTDSLGSITLTINSPKTTNNAFEELPFITNGISNKVEEKNSELIGGSKKEQKVHRITHGSDDIDETIQGIALEYENDNETPHKKKQNQFFTVMNRLIPYQVLGDRASFIFLLSALIRSFGFFIPFVLLPDLAVENYISIEKAAWLASAMGISGAVSRIFLGWVADFHFMDRIYLYTFCLLGSGVLSGVCPSFYSYGLLMMFSCIFGFLMGGECSLTPVICSDVAGRDKLAEMYGMLQTLCGIGATCGVPLSGWLFEKTGGYSVSFIVAGTLITVSGILLLPLKCQKLLNKLRSKY